MTIYKLNEEKMFADINDGIAIIINGQTGIYYGMNNFGTEIFENLISGVSSEKILEELKKLPNSPENIEARFNAFLDAIIEKELVIPSGEIVQAEFKISPEIAVADEFNVNVSQYDDAQELLLADPIHEVKEETGWSPEKQALNPDKEDVARRESKME